MGSRYKKLMSNMAIFAIGTFSSKVLVFLMTRFYTGILTSADYGIADTITQTANVLMPIAAVGITNSVIRFGLEKSYQKQTVFTTGLTVICIGFVILSILSPIVHHIDFLSEYTILIYTYVLMANFQLLCGQFVRARGHVRLYALDGIGRTLTTILFNILFLAVFGWGVEGYVWSVICSNVISILFLFTIDQLYLFISFRSLDKSTVGQMLRYAIPLIPTTVCVWIFNFSDRFFLTAMRTKAETGLYSVSNKIPTILVLISSIFIEAWQITAIDGSKKREQEHFFSKVGNIYQALLFVLASGITMTAKLTTSMLAAPSYYEAWTCIPILVIGSAFSCLSNFLNSIYTLEKKSVASLTTAMCGAGLNLVLNYFMIPKMGILGAALATMISYIFMFLLRSIHSTKYLRVHWKNGRFLLTTILILIQSGLMLYESPFWITQQLAFFIAITALNAEDLTEGILKVLHRRTAKKHTGHAE